MKRFHISCSVCGKRMTRFSEDDDRERMFYYCPNGHRKTFRPDGNLAADDWPQEIFDRAVRDGLFTEEGEFVSQA